MSREEREAKQAEFKRTIPTCSSAKECEVKWAAARLWVLNNSGLKFQTVTPDFMETFNPPSDSDALAASVQKIPAADGSYKIAVGLTCANTFGCRMSPLDGGLDFNKFVTRAWKP
ncbi:MAG: hypothetical protein ACK52I_02165 [Pseudomonadota bacterium]